MNSWKRSRLRLVWLVGCAVVVGGCTDDAGSELVVSSTTTTVELRAESTVAATAPQLRVPSLDEVPPLEDSDLISPTIQLMGHGQTSAYFLNRIEEEVASCMQQRGWTYEPELQDESLGEPLTVGEKRAFVIEYGYGLFTMPVSPHDPSIEAAGRNGQRFRDLSVEDQAAFREDLDGATEEGTPPVAGSCRYEAEQASGSLLYDPVASKEMAEMSQAAYATAQALEVNQAYSRCMAERGYDVDVPADVQLGVMEQGQALPRAEAARIELESALDDFECQLATRLPWSPAVGREIVRILVERYPEYAWEGAGS